MKVITLLLLSFFLTPLGVTAAPLKAEIRCSELQKNEIIHFFNKEIEDKIINVTPDFCLAEPKRSNEDVHFNKIFNTLKKNNKSKPLSEGKEIEAFHIMKSLLLSKLWNRLSNDQRHYVFGNSHCSDPPELYLGFMDFKQENGRESQEDLATYTDICKTKNTQELLPFLDKSLILEYFFVVNLANQNFNFHQKNFCKMVEDNRSRYILGSRFFDPKFNFNEFKKNVDWMLKTNFYEMNDAMAAVTDLAKIHLVPPEYKKVIAFYTGMYYTRINECLRNSTECNQELSIEVAQIKKGLKLIKKKELISFRGAANLPFSVTRKLQKGCLFKDPAFLSTSMDFTVAKEFAAVDGYVFVIRGKNGAIIQNISEAKFEKEVLYPAGTGFVITRDVELGNDAYSKYKLVYLRELEPNEPVKDCNN